ncbi:hypothetical protein QVL82_20315, partial [Cellulosimicrobium funkei]
MEQGTVRSTATTPAPGARPTAAPRRRGPVRRAVARPLVPLYHNKKLPCPRLTGIVFIGGRRINKKVGGGGGGGGG